MSIKVKALEWAEHPSGKPLWRAHAPSIGWYCASAIISPASWRFDGLDETVTYDVADIDAAKAAAQADYERRILSALEPSPDMREAVEALEPFASFAEFAVEPMTDCWGWVDGYGRERIYTWLGPSDFGNALSAFRSLTGAKQ